MAKGRSREFVRFRGRHRVTTIRSSTEASASGETEIIAVIGQTVLPGDTVDINPDLSPTYVDDAQRLERVPLADYDLVLADPPYSVEDAERYQGPRWLSGTSSCGR
jgi:hypothetical protein